MESHQVAMPPDTEETELLLLVVTLLCHWTRVVSAAQAFMHATDVHDSLPQASALSPVSGRRARGSRRWVALAAAPTPRRFWVYPHRSRDWWYNCVWSSWNDEEWLKNFRMSRGTFQRIVDSLAPALRRQDTRMRAALPVEMRVGMAIWYLASPNSFREVRQQFGVGTTTAFEAVHEFCEAVKNILFKRVVRFADPVEKVMRGFANIGFPQCVGAIDGCHIQILNPSDAPADYINRKRVASIVLMAVCDDKGRFFEVDIGHPGRSHDAHIFRGCHFTQAMDRAENQDSPESECRADPLLTQKEEQQPIIIDKGESNSEHLRVEHVALSGCELVGRGGGGDDTVCDQQGMAPNLVGSRKVPNSLPINVQKGYTL
ncbi:putative nuclease HARBI1 [Sphaerodactylus townsendi]|uniref:putative nuclease HARBI1 n=1 Tax=Sphaerodactylus townsendi TaxID=933632 RepID=UPI002025DBC8|nr:putative nuclease HARBI1 [Sphaerodactylus townsendi]